MESEDKKPSVGLVPKTPAAVVAASEKEESYWSRISRHYHMAFRVFLVALVLFLALFPLFFSSAFTYNGFAYFIKDIGNLGNLAGAGDDTVTYRFDGGKTPLAFSYRGGVANVTGEGVEVFAAGGKRLLSVAYPMKEPRAALSKNYLVAYDFGTTRFMVCNSYTELYQGDAGMPIYGASVSDAGYITLITASGKSLSGVLLYDANFRLIQRFERGSATVSAAVSENGRNILLLGASPEGGAVLDLFPMGEKEPKEHFRFNGFPIAAAFTSNSTFSVLTSTGCYACHVDGETINALDFNGGVPLSFSIEKGGISVALEVDRVREYTRVLLMDQKGNIKADTSVEERVVDVAHTEDYLFILKGDTLSALRLKTGKVEKTFSTGKDAVAADAAGKAEVRVFYPAKAEKLTVK